MTLEIGSKVTGKVTSITKFGAFVQLENRQTGMVHISEVSNTYIQDIQEVLSVGDQVTVKVISVAPDGKISLSIKQTEEKAVQEEKPRFQKRQRNQESEDSGQRRLPKQLAEKSEKKSSDFDSLMSAFLKDSDERLLSLKRNVEGKRGGRGGRRG